MHAVASVQVEDGIGVWHNAPKNCIIWDPIVMVATTLVRNDAGQDVGMKPQDGIGVRLNANRLTDMKDHIAMIVNTHKIRACFSLSRGSQCNFPPI